MLIGYARISTHEQNHDLQLDTLTQAGCQTIYTETMSGAKRHRPELEATLKSLRPNDTLVVWLLICIQNCTTEGAANFLD